MWPSYPLVFLGSTGRLRALRSDSAIALMSQHTTRRMIDERLIDSRVTGGDQRELNERESNVERKPGTKPHRRILVGLGDGR
jgi:hypothetical protein